MSSTPQRTAVITGGGGAMGLACARRLGRDHAVVLAELDPARLEAALAALAEDGIPATGVPLDVADPRAVRALAEKAAGLGPLGALVHTAGLSPTSGDGRRIWEVNLRGSALLMSAFERHCARDSVAVLIASQAGHFARTAATPALEAVLDDPLAPDLLERVAEVDAGLLEPAGAYAASKYGVIRMAARESGAWGAAGGRVVSLSPGIIDTGMGRAEYAAQPFMATMVERTPLGRMGSDDEIAKVVEFLCSDGASFVTGCDWLVDGGSTQAVQALIPR